MRRTLWIAAVLLLLLLAYVLWPVAGFYRLASAIEAKDSAKLAELVDFQALQKSLTKQLVHAYLEITGKKREKQNKPKLTLIERSMAIGVGTSIAEPIVAQLLNEKTLLDVLTKGPSGLKGRTGEGREEEAELSNLAPLSKETAAEVWRIWLTSDYRGTDVYVRLPPQKPREEQFRATFSLSGLEWKLAALELPQPVLIQFAKELIAEQKEKQKSE
jgi:hypothetical protein